MAGGIAPGGQLTTTTFVENFPGFVEPIMGYELTDKFRYGMHLLWSELNPLICIEAASFIASLPPRDGKEETSHIAQAPGTQVACAYR